MCSVGGAPAGGSPEGQSHNKGWIMLSRCRLADGIERSGAVINEETAGNC